MPRLRVVLVLLLALVVAGCVSMPGSGPPVKYSAKGGTGQSQVYDVFHPEPPQTGWGPTDIVQGFLAASASYAWDPGPASAYLTPRANQRWNPRNWPATVLAEGQPNETTHSKTAASVQVSGNVLVSLTNTGSVATQVTQSQSSSYKFGLVQVGGQWRIDAPPLNVVVLEQKDFTLAYQTQDVYYVPKEQSLAGRLVPDTVYVPLATTVNDLVTRLVRTILSDPRDWLKGAAGTSIEGTSLIGASASGSTAIVNLGGAIAHASEADQKAMAAQLAYTLGGLPGGQSNIAAVQMQVNGVPSTATGGGLSFTSKQFGSFNPYPQQEAPFTYVDPGTGAALSRCGSVASVSQPVAVFGSAGAQVASCGPVSPAPSATQSPNAGRHGRHNVVNQLAMVVPSPDGKYIATVSANQSKVEIWSERGKSSTATASLPAGVSSISWDQLSNLWITTKAGDVEVLAASGKAQTLDLPVAPTALSIAPDGVRVAMIVNHQLELAAIIPLQVTGSTTPKMLDQPPWGIGSQQVTISPATSSVASFSWYDQDNLMVVAGNSPGSAQIEELSVNGGVVGPSSTTPVRFPAPAGRYPVAIAADSADNVLVVTLNDNELWVATSSDDPSWVQLGPEGKGQAAAYGGPETG